MRTIIFMLLGALLLVNLVCIGLNMSNVWIIVLCGLSVVLLAGLAWLLEKNLFGPIGELKKRCTTFRGGKGPEINADISAGSELAGLDDELSLLGKAYQEKAVLVDTVLGSIITPMVIVDAKGCIEWVNESMIKLTEQDGAHEKFHGLHFSEFFYNDSRETLSDKAIRTQEKQFAKTQMQSHKDNTKYISVASVPIKGAHGEIRGALTTVMDFTNVKLKEDQIMAQNERIATGARQAMDIAHNVAELASKLIQQVSQSEEQAQVQQMRTAEVATAIDEMNATIFEVARNAGSASQAASHTEETVHGGVKVVGDVIKVMADVRTQADLLKSEMNGLGSQAEGIGRIMAVINDIADQTNLLALNAAIEAARAGSAGRGFAVVADEVRKLAEKTMQATSEVGGYIRAIQESTKTSIKATDSTAVVIDQAAGLSQTANESLHTILGLVGQTNDQVRSIATATEEQSAASEEIGKSTNEVSAISQNTVRALHEFQLSVESLARMASELDLAMQNMLTTS